MAPSKPNTAPDAPTVNRGPTRPDSAKPSTPAAVKMTMSRARP